MRKADNRATRTSLLISLIVHTLALSLLGLILLEHPSEPTGEFVSVDMVESTKRILPPRRMQMRDSVLDDLRGPKKQEARADFKPQRLRTADPDFAAKSEEPDTAELFPELSTNASRLKSDFDMALPKPTGASIIKPGDGTGRSGDGTGRGAEAGSVGLGSEAGIFETALYWVARNIVSKNKTGREDIVFLIDASGSMEENIASVARYLGKMIDVFNESDLDFAMCVIRFNLVLKNNDITVYDWSNDPKEIKAILKSIKCDGDERTLDAMEVGLTKVKYRNPVDKTFILVTDEPFTPRTSTRQNRKGVSLKDMLDDDFLEILEISQKNEVKVNVLGIDDPRHKTLAKETGGLWFQIPQPEGTM